MKSSSKVDVLHTQHSRAGYTKQVRRVVAQESWFKNLITRNHEMVFQHTANAN